MANIVFDLLRNSPSKRVGLLTRLYHTIHAGKVWISCSVKEGMNRCMRSESRKETYSCREKYSRQKCTGCQARPLSHSPLREHDDGKRWRCSDAIYGTVCVHYLPLSLATAEARHNKLTIRGNFSSVFVL